MRCEGSPDIQSETRLSNPRQDNLRVRENGSNPVIWGQFGQVAGASGAQELFCRRSFHQDADLSAGYIRQAMGMSVILISKCFGNQGSSFHWAGDEPFVRPKLQGCMVFLLRQSADVGWQWKTKGVGDGCMVRFLAAQVKPPKVCHLFNFHIEHYASHLLKLCPFARRVVKDSVCNNGPMDMIGHGNLDRLALPLKPAFDQSKGDGAV